MFPVATGGEGQLASIWFPRSLRRCPRAALTSNAPHNCCRRACVWTELLVFVAMDVCTMRPLDLSPYHHDPLPSPWVLHHLLIVVPRKSFCLGLFHLNHLMLSAQRILCLFAPPSTCLTAFFCGSYSCRFALSSLLLPPCRSCHSTSC